MEVTLAPIGNYTDSPSLERALYIDWFFEDLDASSPPSNNQFDVTVTDATGRVTGQLVRTGQYTWIPPEGCGNSGYWTGPMLADDAGTD